MSETTPNLSALSQAQRIALERQLLKRRAGRAGSSAIPPRAAGASIPLSFAQQRIWFLQQLEPESAAYRLSFALRMKGTLREDALQWALTRIVERHSALRTVFRLGADGPEQQSQPAVDAIFDRIDLSGTPEAERGERVVAAASEIGARPFDLENGPLFRASLLRLDAREHVLVISIHHIVSDVWSLGVFVRELSRFYQARAAAETDAAAALDPVLEYADFAAWQRDRLRGDVLARELSYWTAQLGGAVPRLDLPTDFVRPEVQSFRGARVPLELPEALASALRSLARRADGTLFTVLTAALNVLLYRYTRQQDILIGFAIAGRHRKELETVIGLFVNTLVLRTDLSGDPSFEALLQRVRETALNAYAHQEAPFEMVVQELHPERDLSRNPLFQVLVGVQNVPMEPVSLPGLDLELVDLDRQDAHVDLTLFVTETPGGLDGVLEYNADLFERSTIEEMARQFTVLLTAAARNPEERISRLPLLDDVDRAASGRSCTARPVAAIGPTLIQARFEAQAASHPDATAVVCDGQRQSYAAINARANQLAHLLRRCGVAPETRVALYLERSIDTVIAILAVLKAGGAYVPLETAYPADRLAFMIDDAQPVVTITERRLSGGLPATSGRVISLDDDRALLDAEPADNPASVTDPANVAYVIYTSGSTGKPKGVLVTHENVCRLLDATDAWFRFGARDVWTVFHSFSFDFSVWELWGPLLTGGCAVIVPYMVSRSPELFLDLLVKERVTVLNQTPSAFRQLSQADAVAGTPALALRVVIFGGEALDFQSLTSWFERRGDSLPQLVNMYGITETTVHVTYRTVTLEDVAAGAGSLIGEPIPDLSIRLVDAAGHPVPAGVPGEIAVGGAGVARGYLGRPDLTADRFVPDPYAAEAGARLYRSGDLARRLHNEDLQYLGRIDDQVKIRGFRIELGEIQQVLAQHPAVQDAVVVPREFAPGDTRLVAYITPHPHRAAPVRELMRRAPDHAARGLERHELPNGMTVVHLNRNETEFLFGEVYEQESYLRHGITIGDNACVFDVGANIGLFTLFASQQARDVRVFAFEPIPPVFERLEANVAVHGVRAELQQAGAAAENGQAVFQYYPHVSIFSGRFADAAHEREVVARFVGNQAAAGGADPASGTALLDELIDARLETVAVECPLVRISDVVRQHRIDRIDLLKVDVEKSEWEVLSGVDAGDWPMIRQVIVEVHDEDGRLSRIVELLGAHGFGVTVEQDALLSGTDLYSVYARRPDAASQTPAPAAPEPVWSSANRIVAETRAAAKRQLPEYMVPAAFTMIESLPLTANGKLDRRALPDVEPQRVDTDGAFAAPRTAVEQTLAGIWSRVLRVPRVGIADNFFELGGDSILSIQVVAAARAEGLRLTPRQMFQHPTIRDLAALEDAAPVAVPVAEGAEAGEVPLTPIQQWFFAQDLVSPSHFNQAVLLQSLEPIDQTALAAAVGEILGRHDALRFRFDRSNRPVRQMLLPAEEIEPSMPESVDLSSAPEDDIPQLIERAATRSQQSLDLESGRLLRCTVFDGGSSGRRSYLLIVIHHLVVDGVSWRILLEDLYEAYAGHLAGTAARTHPGTTSFRQWSARLSQYAHSPELASQAAFWRERLPATAVGLPRDGAGENTVEASDRVIVSLSSDETRQLIQDVPKAYGTQIDDVLLAALSQSVVEWAGQSPVLAHLEGHGREPLFGDEIDLSRTVGWFTTLVPVVLDVGPGADPGEALKHMKEQLRQLPHRGIGYGILRYLSPAATVREYFSALPQPEISFNYQGRFAAAEGAAWMGAPSLSSGLSRAGSGRRAHLVEIDGSVTDDRLRLAWTFATTIHRRRTVEGVAARFVECLRALIAHAVGGDAGGFTPSDFPSARVSQRDLDKLLSRLR
jgi:amino acid adenylation domain-containing protein/non-ribosomal peptide synthase protein (TIGR01720 family)/FkbM family methyltransferase